MADIIKKIKTNKDVNVITYFTTVDASSKEIFEKLKNISSLPTINRQLRIWDTIQQQGKEAYAIKGANNKVVELLEMVDGSYCKRIPLTNEFKFLSEDEEKNVVKGKVFYAKQDYVRPLKNETVEEFIEQAIAYSGNSAYSNVFNTIQKKTDYYADITLKRSIDTLDTLNVKNNLLSEVPTQESDTGVVCGTLVARQKVLDENGERALIPLANVPIVIFNPSEEFPTYTSQDENGNRITLNVIQNSEPEDYSDLNSYVLDVGVDKAREALGSNDVGEEFDGLKPLLKSFESLNLPEHYKYSTITNEKGEFVIHDVPTGNQVLLFEVDLLKQGMNKSEVALNFFPYTNEELPNIDNVPHFYYRQIPISVVSSWGEFQTGFTEVNITSNLDMRKWSTFYVSPISVEDNNLEELFALGNFSRLNILAKDMTKEGYPLTTEIVEVDDIFSRVENQRLEWFNENKFTKSQINFSKNNFQTFKLPANLYDPNGISSKDGGRTKLNSKKGVWLCSYQMKMYYEGNPDVYRTTGFLRDKLEENAVHSSHFDANRGVDSNPSSATGNGYNTSINTFPYERTWTINYPEPYKIPSLPIEYNEKDFNNQVEPRYLDGDLAGFYYGQEESTGYGLMTPLEGGDAIYNKFSQTITKSRIYKYETDVSWHEEYSNGFRKSQHSNLCQGKHFTVKSGEKYQRIECGFAYWLKPEGWGRINNQGWGDIMLNSDINSNYSSSDNKLIPQSYIGANYRQSENLLLKMDSSISPSWLRQGAIDFYRIVDDSPQFLEEKIPSPIKKYGKVVIENIYTNREKAISRLELRISNKKNYRMRISQNSVIEITNNGAIKSEITVNGDKRQVEPKKSISFNVASYTEITFTSNLDYDIQKNSYDTCNYTFKFKNSEIKKVDTIIYDYYNFTLTAGEQTQIPTRYLVTTVYSAEGNVKIKKKGVKKCKKTFNQAGTYQINGLIFEKTKSSSALSFTSSRVGHDCADGGIKILRV